MHTSNGGGAVDWLPWSGDAFRRARAERKPILLSIVASWARGCHEMDRVCYCEPAIAAQIRESLIAIRVDADDRPDIADRYDLGGLPTTAFLTEHGELLGGGTFVPPERLRAAIERVVSRADEPLSASRPLHEGTRNVDDEALLEMVMDSYDEAHGGFGAAPKFPLTAPVRLAIDLYAESHQPAMLEQAVRTLDVMGWGPLYDAESGGFFRCASSGDWTSPEPEKLLQTNISLLDLYLHAGERLGHERWFTRAADVVQYINRDLGGANNGWRVAESASPTRKFTDGNAVAVSAMLRAAAAFNDDGIGRYAVDALERVLLASYKPGHGVGHSAHGVRGLLIDQVAMAAANLDTWEATGNVVYRMMAEELMHYALRMMWDGAEGGFFDRADESRADEPSSGTLKPLALNCEAAVVLARIAQATDDQLFARRAGDTLAAMRERAAESGALAAHYLLARRAVGR